MQEAYEAQHHWNLGRAALKVQSYKCVPAVHFLNRFKAYFPYAIVLMMLLNVGL